MYALLANAQYGKRHFFLRVARKHPIKALRLWRQWRRYRKASRSW